MSPTLRHRRETPRSAVDEGEERNEDNELNRSFSNHSLTTHGFDAPREDPRVVPPNDVKRLSFARDHSVSMDTDSNHEFDHDHDDFNFQDEIRISNLDQIDYPGLIRGMHERFRKKAESWESYAKMYSRWSFTLNFIILLMQMVQMVIAQFIDIFDVTARSARALQCVLAALSGLVVGLQMKLKLIQKAEKYRRGAKVYGKLRRTTVYYLLLLENGGKVDDVTRLWREAMKQESRNVPTVKTFMVT